MKNILEKALQASITYATYRILVKDLIIEKESTSRNGTEALLHYSVLNDKRMDRLDKQAKLNDSIINQLKTLKEKQTWLILTEGWCGDAAQNLPYLTKMADETENIDLKLVLRDEHPELMQLFLTNGGEAIPKLISLNTLNEVLFTWGPRPSIATQMVLDYKQKHGKLSDDFKKDLQLWYTKDKGESLMKDFEKLLA